MKKFKGVLLALLAATISGVAIYYSKISVLKVEPLILTTSRNLYVALIFFVSLISSRKIREVRQLEAKDLRHLVIIGLIGGALPFYLFFSGIQYVTADVANLIHKTLFIWVSILAILFLNEEFKISYLLGYFLILFGNLYFATARLSLGRGELMILAATFLWAIENVVAKKVLARVSSELVGLFRMGIGSLILLSLVFLSGQGEVLLGLNLGQLGTILTGGSLLFFYVFFWYKGLKYAPASLVTAVLSFSVVVGNTLSGVFAGIKTPQSVVYSSLFISLGVSLLSLFYLRAFSVLRKKVHG